VRGWHSDSDDEHHGVACRVSGCGYRVLGVGITARRWKRARRTLVTLPLICCMVEDIACRAYGLGCRSRFVFVRCVRE